MKFLVKLFLIFLCLNVLANGLRPNATLERGQAIVSSEKKYSLVMQADGSLVMYRSDGTVRYAMAKHGQFAIMQNDGNFVEYSPFAVPL